MAKKGGREKIRLNSSAGTGHFYTTTKNRRTTTWFNNCTNGLCI